MNNIVDAWRNLICQGIFNGKLVQHYERYLLTMDSNSNMSLDVSSQVIGALYSLYFFFNGSLNARCRLLSH